MAIQSTDILFKYATGNTGTAGNTTAVSNVNNSLGKFITTSTLSTTVLNNLFDNITGDENANMIPEYRFVFVHNNHPTNTLLSTKLWITAEVSGGANIAIGYAFNTSLTPNQAIPINSTFQWEFINNSYNAPSNITFLSPTTKNTGVGLGDIPAGWCMGFWVRRTPTNSGPMSNDGVTLRVEGETTP